MLRWKNRVKKFRCSLLKLIVSVVKLSMSWGVVMLTSMTCALHPLGYISLLYKLESVSWASLDSLMDSSHPFNTLNLPRTYPVLTPTSPRHTPCSLQVYFLLILTLIQHYSNLPLTLHQKYFVMIIWSLLVKLTTSLKVKQHLCVHIMYKFDLLFVIQLKCSNTQS